MDLINSIFHQQLSKGVSANKPDQKPEPKAKDKKEEVQKQSNEGENLLS